MAKSSKARIRALSSKALALLLGVSERTARRYRASGQVPESRVSDLEKGLKQLAESPIPLKSSRKEQKKLLAMPTRALAAIGGVKLRTARRWKQLGRIPEKRAILLTYDAAPVERPRRLPASRKVFEAKHTEGEVVTVSVQAEISKALVSQLVARFEKLVAGFATAKNRNFQVRVHCKGTFPINVSIGPVTYLGAVIVVNEKAGEFDSDFVVQSYASRNPQKAIAGTFGELFGMHSFPIRVFYCELIVRDFLG